MDGFESHNPLYGQMQITYAAHRDLPAADRDQSAAWFGSIVSPWKVA